MTGARDLILTLKILKQAVFIGTEEKSCEKKPENKGFFKRKISSYVREGGRTVGSGRVATIIE